MRGSKAARMILSVAVLASLGVPRARAEEYRIQATAPWTARARVFVTGPKQVVLLAAFRGRLAVDQEPKRLDGAMLVCPGAFDADYAANTQRGEGRCVITTDSGDRLFARWTCAGVPDQGCTGRFVLTGGTERFQGVTGEGELVLRLGLAELVKIERQESEYEVAGTALWPALTYRTP